jgi:type IV secretion system protein VirB10
MNAGVSPVGDERGIGVVGPSPTPQRGIPGAIPGAIRGERGPAWVKRGTSIQSKVQNALALAVVAVLGGGFLLWYYSRVATTPPPVEETRARAAAAGEMALPPLGPPLAPAPVKAQETRIEEVSPLIDPTSAEGRALLAGGNDPGGYPGYGGPAAVYPAAGTAPPPDPVLQRRLEAPVLIRGMGSYSTATPSSPDAGADAALDGQRSGRPPSGGAAGGNTAGSGTALAGMLQPTRTTAVAAGVMPDRRFLLPKGAFIDCTLETAIDSSLPGMTTCITATDVWSADGSVVLLERGTKLVGETRGEVRQGQERLFVLWSEARTPAGVIVDLASPGTDELGRSGVTGEVDTHFTARFGAAILISLIDAGTAALVASQSNGGSSVVIAPQGASDVVAEVLRQTVNVPPTIRVAQGGRMQVLVARDVSFAEVYSLARR